MKVYNLTKGRIEKEWKDSMADSDFQYFIVATDEEVPFVLKLLSITASTYEKHRSLAEDIRFESHVDYDFLSFIYYEIKDKNFIFENFTTILNKQFLILVVSSGGELHTEFIKNFVENSVYDNSYLKLPVIYYLLLNKAFLKMFEALSLYETELMNVENEISTDLKNFKISDIVEIKNITFRVKKYNRQLLYVGDQLLLNDNGFIDEQDIRYLHNIDSRINKLYEYSDNIHEMSEHLMELYSSSITSQTNRTLNKLTIITVFATPLTVITGLYGMNFVNMPELRSPYGYFIVLGIMLIVIILTYIFVRRSKLL